MAATEVRTGRTARAESGVRAITRKSPVKTVMRPRGEDDLTKGVQNWQTGQNLVLRTAGVDASGSDGPQRRRVAGGLKRSDIEGVMRYNDLSLEPRPMLTGASTCSAPRFSFSRFL